MKFVFNSFLQSFRNMKNHLSLFVIAWICSLNYSTCCDSRKTLQDLDKRKVQRRKARAAGASKVLCIWWRTCLHGRWPSLAGWDRRVTRPFTVDAGWRLPSGKVRPRALITTYSLQISPKVGQSYCRLLVLFEALLPGKVSWPTTLNLRHLL